MGLCGAYGAGAAGQQNGVTDSARFCSLLFRRDMPRQACMAGFSNASAGDPTQPFQLSLSCPYSGGGGGGGGGGDNGENGGGGENPVGDNPVLDMMNYYRAR